MKRWRLVWVLGLVGFVVGSFSTLTAGSSHTVYKHGVLVATTSSGPGANAFAFAMLQALTVAAVFAAMGLLITLVLRWYRSMRIRSGKA